MQAENGGNWWFDYFKDVDSGEYSRFSAWLADDIVVRFGNWPVIRGKATLKGFFVDFFRNFDSIAHTHGKLYRNGDEIAGEAVVTYTKRDGRKISIPGLTVMLRRDDLIRRLTVYIDLSPLFAQDATAAEVSEPLLFVQAPWNLNAPAAA